MPSLIEKFTLSLKQRGVTLTIKKVLAWGLSKVGIKRRDPINLRRLELSKYLDNVFNSTVKYGPFQGLKLQKESWWGTADKGSMLLGLYEQEILVSLTCIPNSYDTFIDLGAADGYYGIGVLINKLFEKSYCFEISEKGRRVIESNAKLNNVMDRVEIFGIAEKVFYKEIPSDRIDNTVLFVDIEGAEFDLFDENTFTAFNKAIIFIELHDWFFLDGAEKLRKLRKDALATHAITELTMASRDLSKFNELKKLNDTDRWLICSEGRSQLMTWLRFDPIESYPNSNN